MTGQVFLLETDYDCLIRLSPVFSVSVRQEAGADFRIAQQGSSPALGEIISIFAAEQV